MGGIGAFLVLAMLFGAGAEQGKMTPERVQTLMMMAETEQIQYALITLECYQTQKSLEQVQRSADSTRVILGRVSRLCFQLQEELEKIEGQKVKIEKMPQKMRGVSRSGTKAERRKP